METPRWKILRRITLAMAFGTALVPAGTAQAAPRTTRLVTSAYESAVCSKGDCAATSGATSEGDRKLGTAINWLPSPDAASHAAADEGKLVFMIQVSGNFAKQEFT